MNIAIGLSLAVSGWLMLWFVPWQTYLDSYLWVRIGTALFIFIIPGAFLFCLISRKPTWITALTFGFVLSHLLVGIMGFLGRLFSLSFKYIETGMLLAGIGFILIFFAINARSLKIPSLKRISLPAILSLALLSLVIAIAVFMSSQRTLSYDDLVYLAYLTNFKNSPALHFNDIFYGTGALTVERFWWVSTPFSQAFLAEISQLHGIFVIGGFYEPFLAIIACLSHFQLARSLGFSRHAATTAVAAQIGFLALLSEYLHPGFSFFNQLSTDKATATFILLPVYLQSLFSLFAVQNRKTLVLCLLASLSLSIMHAGIFALAVLLTGLILLFRFKWSQIKKNLLIAGIITISIAPLILIRFTDFGEQPLYTFDIDTISSVRGMSGIISIWNDTHFYGFNPANLAMSIPYAEVLPIPEGVLQWIWIVIPILSFAFALRGFRSDDLAAYVLASFLLVCLAVIPFTGWIIGYFLSAFMLERTTWMYPYGIGVVFTLKSAWTWLQRNKGLGHWSHNLPQNVNINLSFVGLTIITGLFISLLLATMKAQQLPNFDRLETNAGRYTEFSQIGQFLDRNISRQAVVAGSGELNDLLPGLSRKAKVVSFWSWDPFYSYFFPPSERSERYAHQQMIFSNEVPVEERLDLIDKYDVQFLVLPSGKYHSLKQLISAYPAIFNAHKIGRYLIVEIEN